VSIKINDSNPRTLVYLLDGRGITSLDRLDVYLMSGIPLPFQRNW